MFHCCNNAGAMFRFRPFLVAGCWTSQHVRFCRSGCCRRARDARVCTSRARWETNAQELNQVPMLVQYESTSTPAHPRNHGAPAVHRDYLLGYSKFTVNQSKRLYGSAQVIFLVTRALQEQQYSRIRIERQCTQDKLD